MGLAFRGIAATWIAIVLLFSALAGCTIKLAPSYDAELVAGLNEANAQAMTLFSAAAGGVPQATFPEFEDRYDALLGKLGALKLQAEIRGVPPLSRKAWEELSQFEGFATLCPSAEACVNPSVEALGETILTIEAMKAEHRRQGLGASAVPALLNSYLIYMRLALRFERSLEPE